MWVGLIHVLPYLFDKKYIEFHFIIEMLRCLRQCFRQDQIIHSYTPKRIYV